MRQFELVIEVEEARKQLRALRQTGRVAGCVQKFQELQYRLPGMTDEEAFHTFLSGLQPHLQEHMGAHVQGDLEAALAMAQRLEVYRGGDRAKAGEKGPKKFKKQKKGMSAQVEGSLSGETVQVVQVVKNHSRRRARADQAQVERRPRGEDGKRFNATIVVATTSCEIARSGRKSKRNSVPPREKIRPAPFTHTEGTPGWNP